jgi:lysophospholipase L1-like esterase
MKTILCFGDSNTWGADPAGGPRFDAQTRWASVLRNELGAGYWVVEEGCNGRTTVWDDPIEGDKNGVAYLPACLVSHHPLDLVVIALGTNDLKQRFGVSPEDVARGAGVLAERVQKSGMGPGGSAPKVLLLAPPPFAPMAGTPFEERFAGGEAKSQRLGECFAREARERGCAFLDLGQVIVSSPKDGIHWEPEEHRKLGRAMALTVRALLA